MTTERGIDLSSDVSLDASRGVRAAIGSLVAGAVRLTQSSSDRWDAWKVSFEDIVRPADGLAKCLLTSYVLDEEWLMSKLKDVPLVILCTDDSSRPLHSRAVTRGHITYVTPPFPKFPSYGVMHSKLMLLLHERFLRIVVSSGNLVPYDYDEIVFIQDLPRINTSAPITSFQTDTLKLLRTLGVHEEHLAQSELTAFDWSRISVHMVTSRPGMVSLSNRENSIGLAALAHAVRPFVHSACTFECVGSSLGALEKPWLEDAMCCFQGRLPISSTVKSQKRRGPSESRPDYSNIPVKIVFPTMTYVLESPEGPGGFGTLFCQSKNWDNPNCPHSLFHRCESCCGEGRALHCKIITATTVDGDEPAWWYVGSANFTPSAWGKFVKEKSAVMVANYELGVVFGAQQAAQLCPAGFPFPYHRPLQAYTAEDAPWMQEMARIFEFR